MPKPNIKCKVCGKEYYLCSDGARRAPWRKIVCSPECLIKWEEACNKSQEVPAEPKKESKEAPVEEKPQAKK